MARPLRLQVAGGIYHITARGNEPCSIFRDEFDRRRFLKDIWETLDRFHWRCLAYCLITNHYQVLARSSIPVSPAGCAT